MDNSIGFWVVIGGIVVAWILISRYLKKLRRTALFKKYGDMRIVDAIMNRKFWQGQTKEQLIDSIGRPEDIDEKVYKTKRTEIWKYHQTGKNRYGLRITIENTEVVGWDQKD